MSDFVGIGQVLTPIFYLFGYAVHLPLYTMLTVLDGIVETIFATFSDILSKLYLSICLDLYLRRPCSS